MTLSSPSTVPAPALVLPQPIRLAGVALHPVTMPQALEHIFSSLDAGLGGWVLTPNLEIVRRLSREPETAALCAPATLRLADGMPLIWASRLRRTPLPERVPGSDLIWTVSQAAAAQSRSVYLLGGNPGAADAAAAELLRRHATLRIVGAESPPFGFERDQAYLNRLEQQLISLSPDIIFVALGFPKQEKLIARMRPALPAAWFLGIGISFSFVSGEIRRAPRWMQSAGLEWIHRLAQEPGRLGRRYLVHGLPFAARLLAVSAVEGLSGRARRHGSHVIHGVADNEHSRS